jgi:tetratricopeptide (TPR) repeat protein
MPVPVTSQLPYHQFDSAAAADPADPTPYLEQAQWLIAASSLPELRESAIDAAIVSIERAMKRDPYGLKLRRMHVLAYQEKARITGSTNDLIKAVEAARAALALYPLDPKGFITLADCQVDLGETTNAEEVLQQAIANYERALQIDDNRLAWEELRRMRPKDRDAIRAKIEQVQHLLRANP